MPSSIPFKNRLPHTWPGALLVLLIAVIGLTIYKDYGVAWDEGTIREVGRVNLEYARTGDLSLFEDFRDIDHGAAFEVPLKWGEEALGIKDMGAVHHFRHLVCFLFYTLGLWCAYRLALRLFKAQWIALLGIVMLALQPRIFGHAFFNSKDVPFMVAVLLSLHAIAAALDRRTALLFVLAGGACGFAAGIRIMGLLPLVVAGALLLLEALMAHAGARRSMLKHIALFGAGACVVLYASWPALWSDPVGNLFYSFRRMANYTTWSGTLLFNGVEYPGPALPWYYVPEWVAISTPVCWTLLLLAGGIAGLAHVARLRRIPLRTMRQKMLVLCTAVAALPVLAVVVLHSTLYDDWRHLYFIYPPAVMLALYGAERIARIPSKGLKVALAAACGAEVVATVAAMISAHPYEQVYFNTLVPTRDEYRRRHFDYEYWGTSYGAGLRYILTYDRGAPVTIGLTQAPIYDNAVALPPADTQRIRWTGNIMEQGAYLLTTFRGISGGEPPFPKVYSIVVAGSRVLQVYRVDTTMLHAAAGK